MAKKASSAVIGGFVLSAIALLVAGVVLFGTGDFFKEKQRFILFFDEAVTGISVGSPVKFRGVTIGSVTSVILLADPEKLEVRIPIVIEIDPQKFQFKSEQERDMGDQLDELIELGLRAQLDIESIVTSQLFIQIDFLPDTPVSLSGTVSEYREVPTVKSTWREVSDVLQELPIKKIVENIRDVTDHINLLFESGEVGKIIKDINSAVASAHKLEQEADELLTNLDEELRSVSTEAKSAIKDIQNLVKQMTVNVEKVSGQASTLLVHLDGEIDPLTNNLQQTLQGTRRALEQIESTLLTTEKFISKSDTREKLNKALSEVASAARSLGKLADYLERHPEAFLQGKQQR